MSPDKLRALIKETVKEAATTGIGTGMGTSDASGLGQSTDTSIKKQTEMAKLAQHLDDLTKKVNRLNVFDKTRIPLEDERMKTWWTLRKYLKGKGLAEDHGMGFSHNVGLPQDTNTMNKPTIGET